MTTPTVIVVGAGVAGLSAALSAAEAGAEVTVLERATEKESGGNTRYTEAYLRMKSVDEVADDFADALLGDFMGYPDPSLTGDLTKDYDRWPPNLRTMSVAEPEIVSAFASAAGPTLRWMSGHGVVFTELVTQFLTTSTSRLAPRGGGLAIVEALGAAARRARVRFEWETTALRLVTDDDGAVTGVIGRSVGGKRRVYQGAVVLASGGFEGNAEMQARYYGESGLHVRPICLGGYYNKGEGIQMALDIGAAPCGNFGMFHAEPIDPRSGVSEPSMMIFPYGVLVNKEGRRFTDEAPGPVDATYEQITRTLHHQTDGIGYVILDARLADVPNHKAAIRTDQPPLRAGTIEELADLIGIARDDLRDTIDGYNGACTGGPYDPTHPDGLATSGVRPPKSNWAVPIDKPPFEAYPIISANVFTYGGLKVDTSAHVIDTAGEVVPGLFAAGETVGMYFTHYAGSTSVLKGAVFGKLAGTTAAAGPGQSAA
ncbi:MAG TPA: FAD-dependent oxidoreductase [Trebonia sp.]|jgi:tricarballylate dehydrogenase